jgi:hypothetical protein
MSRLIEAIEANQNFTDLLYTAEVENLLTNANLLKYQRSGGRLLKLSDKKLHELMGVRFYSIPMRFGVDENINLESYFGEYASPLADLIKQAGVRVQQFKATTKKPSPDIADRISKLRDKLDVAQGDTKHGRAAQKRADREQEASYRDATGGDRW